MRFIIMHKTDARWEAGETPSPRLIERVGALLGELQKEQRLLGGEGLRASSQGVRLAFSGGTRTITRGPFEGTNELAAGFSILRARSLDEAVEWATHQAKILGDVDMDIRPVTEPWDIGLGSKPANLDMQRFMVLRKATAATESGSSPSAAQRTELSRLNEESARGGQHLLTENLRPSARGRRYKNTREGVRVIDGPFTESKELIAGYMIISADSLDDAARWVPRYLDVVEAPEVDLRELE
jgi:hypothetical protein